MGGNVFTSALADIWFILEQLLLRQINITTSTFIVFCFVFCSPAKGLGCITIFVSDRIVNTVALAEIRAWDGRSTGRDWPLDLLKTCIVLNICFKWEWENEKFTIRDQKHVFFIFKHSAKKRNYQVFIFILNIGNSFSWASILYEEIEHCLQVYVFLISESYYRIR